MLQIKDIERIFQKSNGVMRTKDLQKLGIQYRNIQKLIEDGYIEKIRYGYYQWQDDKAFSEASIVSNLFPDGILCMDTALAYYNYVDRTPSSWHIAVDSKSSRYRFKIEYPKVTPHYILESRLDVGTSYGEIDGITVRIYDRERTICDCLRNMNRMDGEAFNNAIQNYIKDQEKNIPNLMRYAKILNVEEKIRRIIGVWL